MSECQDDIMIGLGFDKNKTMEDGGIILDFWIIKVIHPNEIPFGSSKNWRTSISFGSSEPILSFEMAFRLFKTWGYSMTTLLFQNIFWIKTRPNGLDSSAS